MNIPNNWLIQRGHLARRIERPAEILPPLRRDPEDKESCRLTLRRWHALPDRGFGKVLRIQDETPNTGWAIIERSFHVAIGYSLPGAAINQWHHPLSQGETIPLRPDLEAELNFGK